LSHYKKTFLLAGLASTTIFLSGQSHAIEPPTKQQDNELNLEEVNKQIETESSEWKSAFHRNKDANDAKCSSSDNATPPQTCIDKSSTKPETSSNNLISGIALKAFYGRSQITSNPYKYLFDKGTVWAIRQANILANRSLQRIPFLAQTTIGMNQITGSTGSFYLDSLLRLKTFKSKNKSDTKGLLFGQTRWSGDWGLENSTLNTGVGVRYKVSDVAMVGLNGFWDYRMVPDTTSHSRLGVGWEGFYKDFEIRNNWYFAGTARKTISKTNSQTTYERVVPGWDLELGYRLPNYPQLSFAVRAFRWDYVSMADNSGIEGSVNWQANPNWNLELAASNELLTSSSNSPSNDDISISLKIKYNFQKIEYPSKDYNAINTIRLNQPVKRRYDVLLERYSNSSSNGGLTLRISGK
tara:strand:+ start:265 stop:1494 length:1230 start_codon:yes stop_codon:yes gene_type:complete